MKTHLWRGTVMFVLALGLVAGFILAATNTQAAGKPAPSASVSPNEGRGCWYLVRHGDTLFSIGLRYGVSPYYLAHLNGLWNPNIIFAGMKLLVPCGGGHPMPPPRPPKPPPYPCGEPLKYVVRPGDNLFRIALNYGTTVNALRDANNLWGRVLRSGTTLLIPCPAPPPKNGDKETVPPPPVPEATTMPSDQGRPTFVPPPLDGRATPVPTDGQATPVPSDQVQPTLVPPPVNGQATPVPSDQPPAELPPEPSASVVLGGTSVDPAAVTISLGQSVVWINNSENIYTILSGAAGTPSGEFTSPELPPGATWIRAFDTAGTYTYYLNENPVLEGQVIVTTP